MKGVGTTADGTAAALIKPAVCLGAEIASAISHYGHVLAKRQHLHVKEFCWQLLGQGLV